jgi:hypothetical protein
LGLPKNYLKGLEPLRAGKRQTWTPRKNIDIYWLSGLPRQKGIWSVWKVWWKELNSIFPVVPGAALPWQIFVLIYCNFSAEL